MAFGVFIHRADSPYEDSPASQYQFPSRYFSRAAKMVGDWIIYYEPKNVPLSKGYNAIARVERIVPDPTKPDMFLALIEPGSYLPFSNNVPSIVEGMPVERGLLNQQGGISGNRQAAVRALSAVDFERILSLGLEENRPVLPRVDSIPEDEILHPELGEQPQQPFAFEVERERIAKLTTRPMRDRIFRRVVLDAYQERCAVTGFKLINGGGRAEVAAAHIRSVEHHGPDIVNNGLALSGTAHWMFDRGLITVEDDLAITISRHVNDRDGARSLINASGRLIGPTHQRDRPHPMFLAWHREHCFKR